MPTSRWTCSAAFCVCWLSPLFVQLGRLRVCGTHACCLKQGHFSTVERANRLLQQRRCWPSGFLFPTVTCRHCVFLSPVAFTFKDHMMMTCMPLCVPFPLQAAMTCPQAQRWLLHCGIGASEDETCEIEATKPACTAFSNWFQASASMFQRLGATNGAYRPEWRSTRTKATKTHHRILKATPKPDPKPKPNPQPQTPQTLKPKSQTLYTPTPPNPEA